MALLLGSLLGLFAGIGLRVQTFVWLRLVTSWLTCSTNWGESAWTMPWPSGRSCSVWASLLIFLVALNEKKQIVATMHRVL